MKRCVPHRTDTLLGSYLLEPTCLFVETLPRLFILPFFPFFRITNILLTSLHIISFCAIDLKVEFVGVLLFVPIWRNSHFSHFFRITNILLTSLHIISFCTIVLKVEFVGVLQFVPLRRNEIRSILGDDCPLSSVQVEGPNLS